MSAVFLSALVVLVRCAEVARLMLTYSARLTGGAGSRRPRERRHLLFGHTSSNAVIINDDMSVCHCDGLLSMCG
jgi:hypothetical protein